MEIRAKSLFFSIISEHICYERSFLKYETVPVIDAVILPFIIFFGAGCGRYIKLKLFVSLK